MSLHCGDGQLCPEDSGRCAQFGCQAAYRRQVAKDRSRYGAATVVPPAAGEVEGAGRGAWTPGPWKHSADSAPPIERDERVWIYAPDANGNHPRIATVEAVMRDGDMCAVNTANARLIAAAPDLYEALTVAGNALHNAVLSLTLQLSPDHEDARAGATALALIRAALRKANPLPHEGEKT